MEEEFEQQGEVGEQEVTSNGSENPQAPLRVRTPRGKEIIGKVDQRVGANRMIVSCFDGKQRNCRVPGRLKRALWIRPGNIVLVEPWEFEGDKKGDIIFSYTPTAIQWLEKRGFLKGINNEF
jgi:translation initiation factor 1A